MPPYGLVLEQLGVIVTVLMREGIVALCREWKSERVVVVGGVVKRLITGEVKYVT